MENESGKSEKKLMDASHLALLLLRIWLIGKQLKF
jgi:hypothetical protein